jgi:hypothetical protein
MGLKVSGSSGSLRHLKPSHAAQRAWRRARSRIHGYPGPSGVTSFPQHLLWIDLIEGDLLGVIRWGQATVPENPTCLCGHCGVDDISGGRRWEEMEIIYGWTWNIRNVTGRGKGSQWRACWLETTNGENRSDYQDLLKLQYPPISSNTLQYPPIYIDLLWPSLQTLQSLVVRWPWFAGLVCRYHTNLRRFRSLVHEEPLWPTKCSQPSIAVVPWASALFGGAWVMYPCCSPNFWSMSWVAGHFGSWGLLYPWRTCMDFQWPSRSQCHGNWIDISF